MSHADARQYGARIIKNTFTLFDVPARDETDSPIPNALTKWFKVMTTPTVSKTGPPAAFNFARRQTT